MNRLQQFIAKAFGIAPFYEAAIEQRKDETQAVIEHLGAALKDNAELQSMLSKAVEINNELTTQVKRLLEERAVQK